MSDPNAAAFVGSIPSNYDRYLGPIFFHAFADDLVARVPIRDGMRVLETACGTGIATERLLDRLAGRGALVATDLNEAMFAHARARGVGGPGLVWRQADASSLPFEDDSFDVVICQFGLMFLPDKAAGIGEAFRVLKPGGHYIFNVWDALTHNPVARIAHETLVSFFPDDPPRFYSVPFGLHEVRAVVAWLESAGFREVEWETLAKVGLSPSAAEAALGLIEGNPIRAEIMSRRPDAVEAIREAVARNLAEELGDRPVRCPLRAHVLRGRKPLPEGR